MSDARQGFDVLRDLLYRPPSADAWRDLCHHLASWPENADRNIAIDYTVEHLERWPDAFRAAPRWWWNALRRNELQPQWRLARTLDLRNAGLSDDTIRALTASPELQHITHLDLTGNSITDAGVRMLGRCRYLERLRELKLADNDITVHGAIALARSALWPRLEVLSLANNHVGPDGIAALAGRSSEGNLVELDVAGTGIGVSGVRAIANAPGMGRLRRLRLARNRLGQNGALALASAGFLHALRELDLADNALFDEGVGALCNGAFLEKVEHLDLSNNGIGAPAMGALSGVELSAMVALKLGHNELGNAGIRALDWTSLTNLATLELTQCGLGWRSMQVVGAECSALRRLRLSRNPLGSRGVGALARSPCADGLVSLDISALSIGADSKVKTLGEGFGRLESLNAAHNPLGAAGLAALNRLELPSLRRLDVSRVHDVERQFEPLFGATYMDQITDLCLQGNGLGRRAVAAMAGRNPPALAALDLSGNGLGDEGAAELSLWLGRSSIRRLSLRSNGIGPVGAAALAACRTQLRELDVSDNPLTDVGLMSLVKAGPWQELERLRVRGAGLAGRSARLMARQRTMPRLSELDISHNRLGVRGVATLLGGPSVARIADLDLRSNGLGANVVLRLGVFSLSRTGVRLHQ